MGRIVLRYRGREVTFQDIEFIRSTIFEHYSKGRSHISRILCSKWEWKQPNGKLKEYAARDFLLRLEEKGFIQLPPRLSEKNNLARRSFNQIPVFKRDDLSGAISDYQLSLRLLEKDDYLWSHLLGQYHYLGLPRLVGEHLRYLAFIEGQVAACIAWASAAWKVKSRDEYIKWDESTKRRNLHLIANNTRFLIPPWVKVRHLASKVLALNLRRLSDDWQGIYQHPVYLAETFVDQTRFKGTCYKAGNWQCVGKTSGSAKRGNDYLYHGQPKAVYLYPLHRDFRRMLTNDQG